MTDNKSNMFSMRSILEKEKLNGENFLNWYQNLRRVLEQEGTLYVLDTILPQPPSADSTMAEKIAFRKHDNDASDVAWLMFASMTPEVQLLHDEKNAFDMIENMKHRYRREIRKERYELSKTLFRCRFLRQLDSVEIHVLKMKGYLERLENLGYPLGQELASDLVLQSLPANLSQYIIDNKLNEIDKSLPDLFQTIKDAEKEISKISPDTSSITQCSKKSDICNTRTNTEGVNVVGVPLQMTNALEPTGGAAVKGICFNCGKKGHWKRNCNIYLEELKKNKESVTCNSGTTELQHATKKCNSLKRKAEVEAKLTPAPKSLHPKKKKKKKTAGQSTTKGPLPEKAQSSKKTISVAGCNPTEKQTVIPKCASCGRLHPGECLFSMLAWPLPIEMPDQTSYSTNSRNIEIQQP